MSKNIKQKTFDAIEEYAKDMPDEIDVNHFIIWLRNNRPDIFYPDIENIETSELHKWIDQYNENK